MNRANSEHVVPQVMALNYLISRQASVSLKGNISFKLGFQWTGLSRAHRDPISFAESQSVRGW